MDNNSTVYTPGGRWNDPEWQQRLEEIGVHCSSRSLQRRLKTIGALSEISFGDVQSEEGLPGHAKIMVDLAEKNDEKRIYMPAPGNRQARDIHIVINPQDRDKVAGTSPENGPVRTPEWSLSSGPFGKLDISH